NGPSRPSTPASATRTPASRTARDGRGRSPAGCGEGVRNRHPLGWGDGFDSRGNPSLRYADTTRGCARWVPITSSRPSRDDGDTMERVEPRIAIFGTTLAASMPKDEAYSRHRLWRF